MIDIHAHLNPSRYFEALAKHGIVPPIVPPWRADSPQQASVLPWSDSSADLKIRLAQMNLAGVSQQYLSPTFAPYLHEESAAREVASVVNDEICRFIARAPKSLKGFASLPLPHIGASLAEIERALDVLKLSGVTLQCFCHEVSIADSSFEPIFEELNRRSAVLFLHPCMNGICSHQILDWRLEAAAGPIFEDTLIALQFMISGIPSRFPDIKIVLPHLGGALPAMLSRLDNQMMASHLLHEKPSATAKRFWYDTCAHGSAATLRMAIEVLGSDRIILGSDFPFLTSHECYASTIGYIKDAGLSEHEVHQIMQENAQRLFMDVKFDELGIQN